MHGSEARSSPHPSALFRPCLQPSERVTARSVPSKPPPGAPGGGFDGTERTRTRSAGRKQDRNSADGCGEDRDGVTPGSVARRSAVADNSAPGQHARHRAAPGPATRRSAEAGNCCIIASSLTGRRSAAAERRSAALPECLTATTSRGTPPRRRSSRHSQTVLILGVTAAYPCSTQPPLPPPVLAESPQPPHLPTSLNLPSSLSSSPFLIPARQTPPQRFVSLIVQTRAGTEVLLCRPRRHAPDSPSQNPDPLQRTDGRGFPGQREPVFRNVDGL